MSQNTNKKEDTPIGCPVNFSLDTLPKQWQYVKPNLSRDGILNQTEVNDIEPRVRLAVEGFLQTTIFAEFRDQIKAEEYEHAPKRTRFHSGTYPKAFTTTFGKTRLLIPKVRKKSRDYVYNLLTKYQRRQKKFDERNTQTF